MRPNTGNMDSWCRKGSRGHKSTIAEQMLDTAAIQQKPQQHTQTTSPSSPSTIPLPAIMSTNLQGKVIAITGAGGGMGLETAKMCAARGAKVSVCDLHEPTLQTLSREITSKGGEVMFQIVDITKEDQVNDWIEKTVQRFGPLDGAVNLAGTLGRKFRKCNTTNQDTEDWKLVLDINLNGVMYSQRAELRHMKDRGSIVNAASVAGWQGTPDGCAYGASKFAVIGLSKCAAVDVGPTRGIRVNAIAP